MLKLNYIGKMLKLNYIATMDFTFKDIIVLNCKDIKELNNKIKKNEVIKIQVCGEIEYINSSYIMYFA